MITVGQITLGSPLGDFLRTEAVQCDRILEVGTGSGLGSTCCLMAGMTEGASLWTVEANKAQYDQGRANIRRQMNKRILVYPMLGLLHKTISDYWHPIDAMQHRECYELDQRTVREGKVIDLPEGRFDLVLLDGGEFTSLGDFMMVRDRTRMLVLDDCNKRVANKNWFAYETLKVSPEWICVREELSDRNGWSAFRRI
jgi:hypothetical protein